MTGGGEGGVFGKRPDLLRFFLGPLPLSISLDWYTHAISLEKYNVMSEHQHLTHSHPQCYCLARVQKFVKALNTKHCQRPNGPMGWHHNWRYLIGTNLANRWHHEVFTAVHWVFARFLSSTTSLRDGRTLRPNDRTPCAHGSNKKKTVL